MGKYSPVMSGIIAATAIVLPFRIDMAAEFGMYPSFFAVERMSFFVDSLTSSIPFSACETVFTEYPVLRAMSLMVTLFLFPCVFDGISISDPVKCRCNYSNICAASSQ